MKYLGGCFCKRAPSQNAAHRLSFNQRGCDAPLDCQLGQLAALLLLYQRHQCVDGFRAEILFRDVDGCQHGMHQLANRPIVKSDNGNILRHAITGVLQRAHHTDSNNIVIGHQSGGELRTRSDDLTKIVVAVAAVVAGAVYLIIGQGKPKLCKCLPVSQRAFAPAADILRRVHIADVRMSHVHQIFYRLKRAHLVVDGDGRNVPCGKIVVNGDIRNGQAFNERVTGMPLQQLSQVKNRIGIGSGMEKAEAVYGALQGGYINILVTDEECARELIWIHEQGMEGTEESV